MTIKAELDSRGTKIYGFNEIILDPAMKRDELLNNSTSLEGLKNECLSTDFSEKLAIEYKAVQGNHRESVKILDQNHVQITRSLATKDAKSEVVGSIVYSGSQINSIQADLILPRLENGEEIRGKLKWERDWPIISRYKRWKNKVNLKKQF